MRIQKDQAYSHSVRSRIVEMNGGFSSSIFSVVAGFDQFREEYDGRNIQH
jgi:hypothetical protein